MKNEKLTIGFVQPTLNSTTTEQLAKNCLAAIKDLILTKHCQLVLLPEMFLGFSRQAKERQVYLQQYQALEKQIKKLCAETKAFVFGSFPEQSDSKLVFNAAKWIGPQTVSTYKKNHLFRFAGEHKQYKAGQRLSYIQSPWGLIQPAICYDIRFPEMFRNPSKHPKLILVCAQWPASRRDHWLTLLKARAIENQAFVIACNSRGQKDALVFEGDSVVFSPWGEPLFHLNNNKEKAAYTIDVSQIDTIRKQYPFLRDK